MPARVAVLLMCILACPGCFQLSQASRDSDEEEWGARWGTDESKAGERPADAAAAEPEERGRQEPAEKAPTISKQDRQESFLPLPPPSPMEKEQQARPARPSSMEPPAPPPPPPEKKVAAKQKKKKRAVRKNRKKPSEPPPGERLQPEEPPAEEPAPPPAPEVVPAPPPVTYPGEIEEPEPAPPPPPRREVVVTPALSPGTSRPLFMIEALGGMLISRGMKVHPGGSICFGLNLGKLLGWKGLYTTLDADVFSTSTALGNHPSILLDALLGFRGNFEVWKLRLVIGIGFGLNHMIVVSGSPEREPELGFGASVMAGVEVPVTKLMAVTVQADFRYMQEPETSRFQPSSMVSAGVVFSF